jgi:tetratricopeptide (TPR) repeat protein
MKMKRLQSIFLLTLICFCPALQAGLDTDLLAVQKQWAEANYATPEKEQEQAFEALQNQARKLAKQYPGSAEPMVWLAIVLSTDAGVTGGLGALGKVKEARRLLESALQIDATVLDGSAYTSLGSLYYQVPGWPIGFGDDEKAESNLKKALAINPDGIDPNYFYGDFMLEQDNYTEAVRYLEKANAAPPRTDRPLADLGRKREISAKLALARSKLQIPN